jgi:hypothetical protein
VISLASISTIIMFSMRTLLSFDPFLPHETREAVGAGRHDAREQLVRLGVNDCEAAELLDDLTPTFAFNSGFGQGPFAERCL